MKRGKTQVRTSIFLSELLQFTMMLSRSLGLLDPRGVWKLDGAHALMKAQAAACPQRQRQPGCVVGPDGGRQCSPQWRLRMELEGDKK